MDNIPMDVIRYHLFPLLDFDSRINMNQCLPVCDRVPKKFDAAFLERHQRNMCVFTLSSYLNTIADMPVGDKKFKKIKKMFKILQTPTFMTFTKKYARLHEEMINKAIEMRTAATYYGTNGSLEVKVALIKEAKKLQAALESART